MRVVYKKPILEQIFEIIKEAKEQGKEIEKIVMTKDEWKLLRTQTRYQFLEDTFLTKWNTGFVAGVPVEIETEATTNVEDTNHA